MSVSIPATSRAAVLEEYGQPLRILDVPIPKVGPGEILAKVELAGICGTDVHQSRGTLTIRPPLPNLQGHETIARIVELGAGRTKDVAGEPLRIGDRIMWAHADCGQCYWCKVARDSVLCSSRQGYGFADPSLLRGGFAEYEHVSAATDVVRVPDELSDEEAVGVGCAFRTVVAGFERIGAAYLCSVIFHWARCLSFFQPALCASTYFFAHSAKVIAAGRRSALRAFIGSMPSRISRWLASALRFASVKVSTRAGPSPIHLGWPLKR